MSDFNEYHFIIQRMHLCGGEVGVRGADPVEVRAGTQAAMQ